MFIPVPKQVTGMTNASGYKHAKVRSRYSVFLQLNKIVIVLFVVLFKTNVTVIKSQKT